MGCTFDLLNGGEKKRGGVWSWGSPKSVDENGGIEKVSS